MVSPVPDCCVIPIETSTFRCLIFGTDGLYNMLSPPAVVHIVQQAERHNEDAALGDDPNMAWLNPSKCLVEKALDNWSYTKVRADNTSVITLLLDPPGPPKAQVRLGASPKVLCCTNLFFGLVSSVRVSCLSLFGKIKALVISAFAFKMFFKK